MRVLLTTLPFSGHFHPLVPVARAVCEAGHDVTFACPASFAARVEAADLLRICRDWQPDVLVRDTSEYGACVAAEALGLPHATVRTGGWSSTYAPRHLWTEALAPLRERAGLDPDPDALPRSAPRPRTAGLRVPR